MVDMFCVKKYFPPGFSFQASFSKIGWKPAADSMSALCSTAWKHVQEALMYSSKPFALPCVVAFDCPAVLLWVVTADALTVPECDGAICVNHNVTHDDVTCHTMIDLQQAPDRVRRTTHKTPCRSSQSTHTRLAYEHKQKQVNTALQPLRSNATYTYTYFYVLSTRFSPFKNKLREQTQNLENANNHNHNNNNNNRISCLVQQALMVWP